MEMMQVKLQLIRDLYESLDTQALNNPNHPSWLDYDHFNPHFATQSLAS